jgi:hypothetical protein
MRLPQQGGWVAGPVVPHNTFGAAGGTRIVIGASRANCAWWGDDIAQLVRRILFVVIFFVFVFRVIDLFGELVGGAKQAHKSGA